MTVATLYATADAGAVTQCESATTSGAPALQGITTISIAGSGTYGKGTSEQKALVLFDISSITGTVTAATFTMVCDGANNGLDAGEEPIVRRCTATWTEADVTTFRDTTNGETGNLGTLASYAAGYNASVSDAAIIAIVEGWRVGTFTNFGLAVGIKTGASVATGENAAFRTRETTAGNTNDPSLTVTFNNTPNVPTNLQQVLPTSDTTPVFQADISDPDSTQQIKGRFQLYQSDGTTLIGTVDSAFRTGAGTVTAEWTSALSVGTYKVQVATVDDSGAISAYTSQITFYVTTQITKDETLLWTVTGQITKDETLLWDVQASVKELTVLWNTEITVTKDLTVLWNSKTPWTTVPKDDDSTSWTGVEL